ncbi:hypothetical protein GCM10023107_59850 [Actinoplanes octamycinicus]|nr:hypothetical protein Aoc01nite_71240 [Actinoplanes octamycinicus]
MRSRTWAFAEALAVGCGAASEAAAGPALIARPAATAKPVIARPRISLFIGITFSVRKVISDKLIIWIARLSGWRHTNTIG